MAHADVARPQSRLRIWQLGVRLHRQQRRREPLLLHSQRVSKPVVVSRNSQPANRAGWVMGRDRRGAATLCFPAVERGTHHARRVPCLSQPRHEMHESPM